MVRWQMQETGKLRFAVMSEKSDLFGMNELKRVKADRGLDPQLHDFLRNVGRSKWFVDGTWERVEAQRAREAGHEA